MRRGYWFLFAVLVSSSPACAQTTNSMASNGDWDEPTAWSEGHVPTGTETVEIQAGVTANARTGVSATYTGDLILRPGAEVYQWSAEWIGNYLPAATNSTIYLHDGATLLTRHGSSSTTDNPIVIDGGVTIAKGTYYNAADWKIDSVITGSGSITYSFTASGSPAANREIFLTPSSPSTYSGGTTVTNALGKEQVLRAYADGAFGTGDLTIKTASAVALAGTRDVIDDSAGLYIEGTGILNLGNNNETIHHCYIDGIRQPDGDYTSAESWLLGTGTLTVDGPPAGTVFIVH